MKKSITLVIGIEFWISLNEKLDFILTGKGRTKKSLLIALQDKKDDPKSYTLFLAVIIAGPAFAVEKNPHCNAMRLNS